MQFSRWRDTTHPIGTLPFFCVFLAEHYKNSDTMNIASLCNPLSNTDNRQLNYILSGGMAENHFHLKGICSILYAFMDLLNERCDAQA